MDIIIYALGTHGDIDPMVAIASALLKRGHRVSFLSNDYFEENIRKSGCAFFSVGTCEQYRKGNSDHAWQAENIEDNFRYYHAPAFEPAFRYVMAHARSDAAALVLGNNSGAEAACEQRGIPYVKVILSPNLIFSAIEPPAPLRWAIPESAPRWLLRLLLKRHRKIKFKRFCNATYTEEYRKLRERLGCPIRYQKSTHAQFSIGLFPEWYACRAKDWPANLYLLNFPLANSRCEAAREIFDQCCQQLGSPIIFTAGSGRASAEQLFTVGRKVCEQLRVPGMFVGGRDSAGLLQGSVLCEHIDYIDFEYAFSKAKLVVHHGGIGTVAQAVKAGIAQLICPVKYDQPDNADRIYRLGLGTYVLPEQFSAENIAPMIHSMLEQAPNATALKRYAFAMTEVDAVSDACDLIESRLIHGG